MTVRVSAGVATWDDAAEALLQHHEGKLVIERSQH